jgi:hypothetical protein
VSGQPASPSGRRRPGQPSCATTPAPSALIVIGIEMLVIAATIAYAWTEPPNVGHAATWFGERLTDPRGPKGT